MAVGINFIMVPDRRMSPRGDPAHFIEPCSLTEFGSRTRVLLSNGRHSRHMK